MNTRWPEQPGRLALAAALTAAVCSGAIYLLQHFVWHDDQGWTGVLILFVVLFLIYQIGPSIRRFRRGRKSS
jgi:hypothetical protein